MTLGPWIAAGFSIAALSWGATVTGLRSAVPADLLGPMVTVGRGACGCRPGWPERAAADPAPCGGPIPEERPDGARVGATGAAGAGATGAACAGAATGASTT